MRRQDNHIAIIFWFIFNIFYSAFHLHLTDSAGTIVCIPDMNSYKDGMLKFFHQGTFSKKFLHYTIYLWSK